LFFKHYQKIGNCFFKTLIAVANLLSKQYDELHAFQTYQKKNFMLFKGVIYMILLFEIIKNTVIVLIT
jgi:hypothetical protein